MAINLYVFLAASFFTSAIIAKMIVGGYRNCPTDRTDVKEAAVFAVMKYNEGSNDLNIYKVLNITSAATQVVAGTNIKLTVEIGKTTCQKNKMSDYGSGHVCPMENSNMLQTYHCEFTVFKPLPPDEHKLCLTKNDCKRD